MSENTSKRKRRIFGVILAIALTGPIIGLILGISGIVFTPVRIWIEFTSLLYVAVLLIGVLIGIIAILKKEIGVGHFLLALVLLAFVTVFYLAFLPSLPNGMTNCEPLVATAPQVRYKCVSTSSDNTSYREEFIIEGREGWFLMRIAR